MIGKSNNHKFEALDGLRGILALAVALHHFPVSSHIFESGYIRTAGVAVDFFFVLSGFVITHASLPSLTSWKAAAVFAVRRFGRLWPLHATTLAALILLEVAKLIFTGSTGFEGKLAAFAPGSPKSIASIFTNLFMIQSLDIHSTWTWNGPSWSISTEFYTYLLFAAIAVIAARYVTSIVSLLALGCGLFFAYMGPTAETTFQYGIFRCICGFFIGHAVYRLWQFYPRLKSPMPWEFGCLALIAVFPWISALRDYSIFIPILLAIPVWVFAHQQGPLSRGLMSRPIQYLGLLSYSIYLDHQFVIDIVKRTLSVLERLIHTQLRFSTDIDGVVGDFFIVGNAWIGDLVTLGFICAVVALAGLTYRLVEVPSRRYFNSLAKRMQTAAPAPIPAIDHRPLTEGERAL